MKKPLKKILGWMARNQRCWNLLEHSLFKLTRLLERARFHNNNAPPPPALDFAAALKVISPDMTVRNGPFRGMKYPSGKSVGSELIPKLLGSYERELHPLLARLRSREYSEIVDIGCAEGFYAVGLALLFPQARIFAYDTNPEGIRLCRRMAQANGVVNRLTTGAFCDALQLQRLPLTRRALILCDCEGYEKHLFTPETVRVLAAHDVLIEIHDMIDISISERMEKVFRDTHELEVIISVDDIRKAHTYDYTELSSFSLAERKLLLMEWRASIMEWFYFSPRSANQS